MDFKTILMPKGIFAKCLSQKSYSCLKCALVSLILENLKDFQIHFSRTFFSKGSRLKDKNPKYKDNTNFISKHHFLYSKNVAEFIE